METFKVWPLYCNWCLSSIIYVYIHVLLYRGGHRRSDYYHNYRIYKTLRFIINKKQHNCPSWSIKATKTNSRLNCAHSLLPLLYSPSPRDSHTMSFGLFRMRSRYHNHFLRSRTWLAWNKHEDTNCIQHFIFHYIYKVTLYLNIRWSAIFKKSI